MIRSSINHRLSALPAMQYEVLRPCLEPTVFLPGEILFEPGDEVRQLFFPLTGAIAQVAVMNDGHSIETASIDRNGIIGAMAGLGRHVSSVRAVALLETKCLRIDAAIFRARARENSALLEMCAVETQYLLAQTQTISACNSFHSVQKRLGRLLLHLGDETENETFSVTQETLADVLGVRRTSVTETAHELLVSGVISYSRGVIKIVDREKLKITACTCYRRLKPLRMEIQPQVRFADLKMVPQ